MSQCAIKNCGDIFAQRPVHFPVELYLKFAEYLNSVTMDSFNLSTILSISSVQFL